MTGPPELRGTVRVGCSGWDYPSWRGRFYPDALPRSHWFGHYARFFDTVELNATFYRLPDPGTVAAWRHRAPDGFVYATKLGQYGSHRRKLREPASWLPHHFERVDGLGSAKGPTLVQLPPRWHRDTARLEGFLDAVPTDERVAVELRDPSWLHDEVYATLERHGAALCLHDLLPDHPRVLTTGWTYLRFHGPDALRQPYIGRYTGRRLWRLAEQAGAWADDGVDVYAYFNNDTDAAAPVDARWFRDRIAAAR